MSTVADLPPSAKILHGSKPWTGSQDQSNREETYTWKCLYSESNDFYEAVVGNNVTYNYGNGITITRRVPLQNPYNPSLWAKGMSWEAKVGLPVPPDVPYKWVLFTVSFGFPSFQISNDSMGDPDKNTQDPPFIKTTSQSNGRVVTDVKRTYKYDPGGESALVNLKQDVGKFFAGRSYEITLFGIPDLAAWQNIVAPLDNKVNSTVITLGGYDRQPGTVLFEGSGYEIEFDVAGNVKWTGTVKLNCSSLPWNKIYIGGAARAITPSPYETTDLNVLYY